MQYIDYTPLAVVSFQEESCAWLTITVSNLLEWRQGNDGYLLRCIVWPYILSLIKKKKT